MVIRYDKFVVDKDGVIANILLALIKAESMHLGNKTLKDDIKLAYEKSRHQK